MGNVTYQSIFEMPRAENLFGTDMLLVARGNQTYYSTYQTTFDMLSDQVYNAFVEQAYHLSVISDESQLSQSATSKAVAGNIGYAFKTRIANLDTSTVKLAGNQRIDGVKTFSAIPKAPKSSGTDDELANCKYVKDLVQAETSIQIPIFSTVFINQSLNFTTSSGRLCPFRANSSKFPSDYTIYCIFSNTSTSKYEPTFTVKDNGTDLPVTLYAGTKKICSKTTDTIKQNACYSCLVSGRHNVSISINNKNANVQVSLSIYRGHASNPST